MSELSNLVLFNTLPTKSIQKVNSTIAPKYTSGVINYAPQRVDKKQREDYFVNSKNVENKQINPIISTIDDCLVRVAPKLFMAKYISEDAIKEAVKNNPKIAEIMASKGLDVNINMNNILGKTQEHFLETHNKAKEMATGLSVSDYSCLLKASLLHDIGKVFIPSEILEKPGALDKQEREIINLHAEVGAEVLKAMNFEPKIVEAVRLHHTDYKDPKKYNDELSQIISIADVYSALKEERPYKKPFTNEQVREIMQGDSRLNQEIVSDLFIAEDISNSKQFEIKKTAC